MGFFSYQFFQALKHTIKRIKSNICSRIRSILPAKNESKHTVLMLLHNPFNKGWTIAENPSLHLLLGNLLHHEKELL